jgi:N-acetylneuraminic acid mutarotase
MLYDAKSDRLILSELSTGRLVSLPVPRSLAKGDGWTRKANLPTPRLGLSSCVLNGKIYAIGGVKQPEVDDDGLKSIQEYDPVTDSWTAKANLPTARNWTSCAAVNGKIYVFGGDTTFLSNPLKTVSEYDPTTDKWARKADMPTARLATAAAVIDGKIYVMGGLTTVGATLLATVEVYDPVMDTWAKKAPMPTPRGMLCASVVEGKIFTIGSNLGRTGPALPTMEMYDPLSDTWTRKASMLTSRGGLAASTAHGRIYVVGGRDTSSTFASVEEYDPKTDTWTKRADMRSTSLGSPSRSFGLAAAEVNGRIYAIGGASDLVTRQGLAQVIEYTPPAIAPPLRLRDAGQGVFRLEWSGRTDALDLLQTQNQLQPTGWTNFGRFSGTGQSQSKDVSASDPAAFYRLQRELR